MKYFNINYLWKTFLLSLPILAESERNNNSSKLSDFSGLEQNIPKNYSLTATAKLVPEEHQEIITNGTTWLRKRKILNKKLEKDEQKLKENLLKAKRLQNLELIWNAEELILNSMQLHLEEDEQKLKEMQKKLEEAEQILVLMKTTPLTRSESQHDKQWRILAAEREVNRHKLLVEQMLKKVDEHRLETMQLRRKQTSFNATILNIKRELQESKNEMDKIEKLRNNQLEDWKEHQKRVMLETPEIKNKNTKDLLLIRKENNSFINFINTVNDVNWAQNKTAVCVHVAGQIMALSQAWKEELFLLESSGVLFKSRALLFYDPKTDTTFFKNVALYFPVLKTSEFFEKIDTFISGTNILEDQCISIDKIIDWEPEEIKNKQKYCKYTIYNILGGIVAYELEYHKKISYIEFEINEIINFFFNGKIGDATGIASLNDKTWLSVKREIKNNITAIITDNPSRFKKLIKSCEVLEHLNANQINQILEHDEFPSEVIELLKKEEMLTTLPSQETTSQPILTTLPTQQFEQNSHTSKEENNYFNGNEVLILLVGAMFAAMAGVGIVYKKPAVVKTPKLEAAFLTKLTVLSQSQSTITEVQPQDGMNDYLEQHQREHEIAPLLPIDSINAMAHQSQANTQERTLQL